MRTGTAVVMSVLLLCTMAAGAEERSLPLRNPQPEVFRNYEALQVMDRDALRQAVGEMTPKMRADVWTVHLLRVMGQHPEFTAEQRSLIYEALGLIASGIFEIDRTSPEWTTQGRPTLLDLAMRVNSAFPPEVSRMLMSDPRDGRTVPATPKDRLNRFRIGVNTPYCTCSMYFQSDCGEGICRDPYPYFCWPYHSCGPWLSDTCDGVCG